MKKSLTAAVLVALSALGLGSIAHAEEDAPDVRQLNRWGVPPTPENIARYQAEIGAAPYGYGGLPLSRAYPINRHHRGYVLDNWPQLGLAAPPAGYQWMRIGNNYVLADQYTGAVAQTLRIR